MLRVYGILVSIVMVTNFPKLSHPAVIRKDDNNENVCFPKLRSQTVQEPLADGSRGKTVVDSFF